MRQGVRKQTFHNIFVTLEAMWLKLEDEITWFISLSFAYEWKASTVNSCPKNSIQTSLQLIFSPLQT